MNFRAGHCVQKALIELSKVIAPALDTSKLLAKMFIDLSETMSIILLLDHYRQVLYDSLLSPFLSLT